MRLAIGVCALLVVAPVFAEEITVAEGKLAFTPPAEWKPTKPASRIVEVEYKVEPIEGEETAGRMTVMGAGGSIDDNIKRWYGQFEQPNGKATSDVAKIEKTSVGGLEIHLADISGTYDDKPGPFVPGVKRQNHRMLAAIIVTKDLGNYYIKFHGPQGTVAKNKDAFLKMVESVKVK